jgi:hypothetical protein
MLKEKVRQRLPIEGKGRGGEFGKIETNKTQLISTSITTGNKHMNLLRKNAVDSHVSEDLFGDLVQDLS